MTSLPRPAPAEIGSLTGLRGVAATLVMLDHYAALDFGAPFPLDMLPHMYLAVDMFMVLSGFVLAMTYEGRLRFPTPAAGYRRFVLRRVARLFPLYALATLVCFVLCRAGWLTFLHPDTSGAALLANLLGVQTWLWPGTSLDGPGWSISTEWFASLAFPLLVPVVLGRSAPRAAWAAGLALVLLACSAIWFGQLFDVPSPGAVNIISGPQALGRCVPEFVIGMWCWRLRARWRPARALGGGGVQAALLVLLFLLMQRTELDVAAVVACAALIAGLALQASWLARLLATRPLLFLGRISYSIYLLHIALLPLRDALAAWLGQRGIAGAWGLAVGCCALATLLLAVLARRFVEVPAQRAIAAAAPGRSPIRF